MLDREAAKKQFQYIQIVTQMMSATIQTIHEGLDCPELEIETKQEMLAIYADMSISYQPLYSMYKSLIMEMEVMYDIIE
jgi:hypothetical protein